MSDLKTRFEAAVAASKTLDEKPDNLALLKLYALYKQSTAGDVQGDRPGVAEFVRRAKWDAWHAISGKSTDVAMQEYIDLVASLR